MWTPSEHWDRKNELIGKNWKSSKKKRDIKKNSQIGIQQQHIKKDFKKSTQNSKLSKSHLEKPTPLSTQIKNPKKRTFSSKRKPLKNIISSSQTSHYYPRPFSTQDAHPWENRLTSIMEESTNEIKRQSTTPSEKSNWA